MEKPPNPSHAAVPAACGFCADGSETSDAGAWGSNARLRVTGHKMENMIRDWLDLVSKDPVPRVPRKDAIRVTRGCGYGTGRKC